MKKWFTFLFVSLTSQNIFAQFQYVSPMPGSTMVNVEHNIIIREGDFIDPAFLESDLFTIHGSRSGDHHFKMVLCDDGKTIVLNPSSPFSYSEEVTVTVAKGFRTDGRKTVTPYSFSFFTHREYSFKEIKELNDAPKIAAMQELKEAGYNIDQENDNATRSVITGAFQISVNTSPSSGLVFFDCFNGFQTGSIYDGLYIISTNGDSIFSNQDAGKFIGDWDLNPSGDLSRVNTDSERFELLDSNYNIIDYYTPANGYAMNGHEFTKYANGHAFLIADETQIMDLTVYNPNYSNHASVIWGVIQEFDANKNLVWEWRSFDHVAITETNQNLHLTTIDATHTNSIELDADGNVIISHRDLNQVMKIDHNTGDFIWRLGGAMNQFTFTNDAEQFNYQHDARIISNGHLTLWDNGNGHTVHHSTAKEYQLDVANYTATLVWSYSPINSSNGNAAYYSAMGNVQRLSNGNTFINCGYDFSPTQPNILEVTPAGQVVWELDLNDDINLESYRAHHHDWNPCAPVNVQHITVKKITATSAKVTWQAVSDAVSYDVQYKRIDKTVWKLKNSITLSKKLNNLTASKSYEFQVRTHCTNGFISDWSPRDTFTTAAQKLFPDDAAKEDATLELHPNPVHDVLFITCNADEDDPIAISIYDLTGKLMLASTAAAVDDALQLNVSSLLPGFYFVQVISGNEKQIGQFMKQ